VSRSRDVLRVVIFGGGVCGLLVRNYLHSLGCSTLLLSKGPLGDGQTVGSQGILHAGLKYAADGASHEISRQLEVAQEFWSGCLSSGLPIDLRSVRVLSPNTHFWTAGNMLDRAVGVAAAAVMKAGAKRLERPAYPPIFAEAPPSVGVWQVNEKVIDPVSLVQTLRDMPGGEIVVAADEPLVTVKAGDVEVRVGERIIRAEHAVFAAGGGNEALLKAGGVDPLQTCQRRPLHMLYASGVPASLFAHCLQLSDKPRLTVTTGQGREGPVWYIGGDVAEKGVERSTADQIEAGKAELAATLPWLDLSGLQWGTIRIDRAEGLVQTHAGGLKRPDGPVIKRHPGLSAIWPTKLAMAPFAATLAVAHVSETLGLDLGGVDGVPTVANTHVPVAFAQWDRGGAC